jgi:cyclic 2,3-diphosphoglycerate synthetase
MAGNPFVSNVVVGAELANRIDADFVVLEGSGAAIPPVQADGYILTINASQPMDYITGYFGTYRVLMSDMVIISMCEPPLADDEKVEQIDAAIRKIKPGIKIVHTKFRPKPLKSIEDKKVFLATTAPESTKDRICGHLEEWYGAKVVGASCNLSNRSSLRRDIEAAGGTFTTLLTELKAAAVDVVTSIGLELGLEVIYMDNIPVTTGGDGDLDQLVLDMGETVKECFVGRRVN